MAEQINLDTAADEVRQFFLGLGPIREPVELVSGGVVVARLAGVSDLSEEEKLRIRVEMRDLVQRARAHTKGIPAAEIQQVVDEAVREVRARAAQRDH
ncbi:MAG: hypothetical protein ACREHD_01760 [Pirellulales bacterium]